MRRRPARIHAVQSNSLSRQASRWPGQRQPAATERVNPNSDIPGHLNSRPDPWPCFGTLCAVHGSTAPCFLRPNLHRSVLGLAPFSADATAHCYTDARRAARAEPSHISRFKRALNARQPSPSDVQYDATTCPLLLGTLTLQLARQARTTANARSLRRKHC
jgi:hypothetical protein